MKKRTITSLTLNKKTVSKLTLEGNINGGANSMFCMSGTPNCITKSHIFICCPEPAPEPLPEPMPLPTPVPSSVFPRCNSHLGACPM